MLREQYAVKCLLILVSKLTDPAASVNKEQGVTLTRARTNKEKLSLSETKGKRGMGVKRRVQSGSCKCMIEYESIGVESKIHTTTATRPADLNTRLSW